MSRPKENFDVKLTRVNINLSEDCKNWFMYKAKCMGMNMSNYMAFVLSNFYEQNLNQETLRNISQLNDNPDIQSLNASVRELLQLFADMADDNEKALTENSKNGNS